MNISTVNSKQTSIASQLASANTKTAGADKLSEQKNIPSTDRDGDKDNSVARDSVELSRDALQLATTSSVQGVTNQTQIPDRQQAQKVLDQLVTSIRSQPNLAQIAFGNISPAKAGTLMA